VRIFFSTRAVDHGNGKYRSHVAFVDMNKDLRTIIHVSAQPVIKLGGLGSFDEHGIFPMNVVAHNGIVLGYTCGWSRRVSTSVETSIGLAMSRDNGLTFEKFGEGPVLGASLREPFLVGDGFVRIIEDTFHMWYIFGTEWKRFSANSAPDRTYKIGHATSSDGVHWIKEEARQIIVDRLGPDESQALPTVIEIDNRHHMFFCYRESSDFRSNPARGYRIGHAYSDDLRNWCREDDDPRIQSSEGSWDSDMMCYPNAFWCEDRVYLLYNGNGFGRRGFGLAVLE